MRSQQVWIGLGSNLEGPTKQIQTALQELNELPQSTLAAVSPLYQSKPVGPQDQPDFINAVALLETQLQPLQLLDELQQLEQKHRRVRKQHWGPRTLDLDILLFDNRTINHQRLQVPHPYLTERNFVIYPLLEIAPDLQLPDGRALAALKSQCPLGSLRILPL